MNIAIVGVSGLVGRMFLKVLKEREIKFDNLYLFASKKSTGKQIKFKNKTYSILPLKLSIIKKIAADYVLFSAGAKISRAWAYKFVSNGSIVIDNSSAFRKQKNIPLVVPEVNKADIFLHNGIIANPNCSTIQAVAAIKQLFDKYGIKRIIYSTYQSVSGAGQKGINDLCKNSKKLEKFDYPIKNNLIPYIDKFFKNGYTKEEEKLIFETKKIFHDKSLQITATAIRVPIKNCHGESINVQLKTKFDIKDIKLLYKHQKNIILLDDISKKIFPMPIIAKNKDEVFVGRIRKDYSIKNGINIWVVADNLRKGAASNAIDILECLISGENA